MKVLEQINKSIARVEGWLLIAVVLFMVVFAFLQVLLRNFFSQGFMGGDILLRHLVLWVGFIGASLATRDEKHINIDILSRFLKGRLLLTLQALVYIFSAIVSYFLTTASISFVLQEREFSTVLFGNVQAWYFQIIIPIGFLLITLRFLILALTKALNISKKSESKE